MRISKIRYYDVIIIGAGIAGTGLAYNLKRFGYKGSVLIIDKNKIGANAAYGYRNTFEEIIREYDLPYVKKYTGVKLGSFKGITVDIKRDFYFVDYQKVCDYFLKKSKYKFKNEIAVNIKNNLLKTNKDIYRFRYLIDCTGPSFFLRKLLKMPLPFKYFIGRVNVYKGKAKDFSKEHFYYLGDKKGYVEDFYILGNKIIQGDWQITDEVNFNKLKSPSYSLINQLKERPKHLKQDYVIGPVSPVFPIVHKNYAFLGDSFGNATACVGEGIRPILDSSKILVNAIQKNNLKLYEKEWKKKYFNPYVKMIASRSNLKDRFEVLKLFKSNQELLIKLIRNEDIKIPGSIMKRYPKRLILNTLYNYFLLKLKYAYFRLV
jgi:flavin-dependent dehydrogenase